MGVFDDEITTNDLIDNGFIKSYTDPNEWVSIFACIENFSVTPIRYNIKDNTIKCMYGVYKIQDVNDLKVIMHELTKPESFSINSETHKNRLILKDLF